MEENLVYLKKISKPIVNYDFIRLALGDKSKIKKETQNKKESVFTEKDFKDFEKTYFKK